MKRTHWRMFMWMCISVSVLHFFAVLVLDRSGAEPFAYLVLAHLCRAEAKRTPP